MRGGGGWKSIALCWSAGARRGGVIEPLLVYLGRATSRAKQTAARATLHPALLALMMALVASSDRYPTCRRSRAGRRDNRNNTGADFSGRATAAAEGSGRRRCLAVWSQGSSGSMAAALSVPDLPPVPSLLARSARQGTRTHTAWRRTPHQFALVGVQHSHGAAPGPTWGTGTAYRLGLRAGTSAALSPPVRRPCTLPRSTRTATRSLVLSRTTRAA